MSGGGGRAFPAPKKFRTLLSRAEEERLHLLQEECAEVIQAAAKVLRHGYESYDPTVKGGPNNREALEKEMGHVRHAMLRMCEANDVVKDEVHRHADHKRETVEEWLHFQPRRKLPS